MRKNRLKQLWADDKPGYGIWANLGSPAVIEAIAATNLDFILLDAEHGVASWEGCFPLLQAMHGFTPTSIIRVPGSDRIPIKRSLDMGAEGILVPYVKSVEEVERVVEYCRYPPVGTRGVGPYRASHYELKFTEYYENANAEILTIVQIETVEALEAVEDIVKVPGLDAVFVGPADLAATMGFFPDMNHPDVQAAVARILKAARDAGIQAGYYCVSGGAAKARADQGFRMMNVGSDMVMLLNEVQAQLSDAHGSSYEKIDSIT